MFQGHLPVLLTGTLEGSLAPVRMMKSYGSGQRYLPLLLPLGNWAALNSSQALMKDLQLR